MYSHKPDAERNGNLELLIIHVVSGMEKNDEKKRSSWGDIPKD
jgi:hypothetical protein